MLRILGYSDTENDAGNLYITCELVNFKKPNNDNLSEANFTSVKRVKLNFEKLSLIISYSTVSEIVNETPMYAMINVKGTRLILKNPNKRFTKMAECYK